MLAIIGGSGLTQLANLAQVRREVVRTPWGEPSGPLTFGALCDEPVVFLARHGYGHTIPPHRVNYRANIWALREAGARAIVSVASVGSIRADWGPGTLVVPDQIIDYTSGRDCTYHDGGEAGVRHVDFTHPYDQVLRARLLAALTIAGERAIDGGVYAATQGPRLETAAEVSRLERDGAELIGMTGMPEAVLARELELSYASLSVVANYAAGRFDSAERISLVDVEAVLQDAMARVRRVLEEICRVCA